jgi:sigma-B regulation protein RsbQ
MAKQATRIDEAAGPREVAGANVLSRHGVNVTGRGATPMVFAHGFGCDQNMWRLVTPAFEDDYRLVLFDYVGHGKSDRSAYDAGKYASLDGFADDVLDILEALDLREVIFVGHSVSAVIGIRAAIREPSRFQSLILVGPSPCYVDDGEYVGGFTRANIEELLDFLDSNHLGWSSAMAPAIMGNPDRPELGAELTNSFCRTDPDVAQQFARVTFLSDTRSDLPKVTHPSLILQCAQDVIAPTAVGEYVHRHLAGSRMVELNATGHCPHLSAPAETVAAIKAFLGSQRGNEAHVG